MTAFEGTIMDEKTFRNNLTDNHHQVPGAIGSPGKTSSAYVTESEIPNVLYFLFVGASIQRVFKC